MMKRVFTLMLAICLLLTSSSLALMEEDTDIILSAAEFVSDEMEAAVEETDEFELGEGIEIEAPETVVEAPTEVEALEDEAEPAAEPTVEAEPAIEAQPEAEPAVEAEPVVEAQPEAEPVVETAPAETAAPVVAAPVETAEKTINAAAATVVQYTLTKKSSTTLVMPNTLQINLAAGVTAKKYASSKKSVATVSKTGLVTPRKAGKAKITVTLTGKKKKTLVLTVTVKDPTIPTSVFLSKDGKTKLTGTIIVNKGTKLQLIPVLNSAEARTTYKWSTSKKKVATISKGGVVTPKKEGTTKITVKTVRGKKKAAIKVKVVDPYKATAVRLNKSGTILVPLKTTLKLTATMTPANSTSKLSWTSSKKKVATVSKSGVVTPKKKGTTKITVKTSTGKKASVKIQVVAAEGTPTGLIPEFTFNEADNTLDKGETRTYVVSLSPFPAKGNVVWTSDNTQSVKVKSYYRGDDLSYYADIVAVDIGYANITVKETTSGKSTRFKVTVKPPVQPQSIRFPDLSNKTFVMNKGTKADVEYEVLPQDSLSADANRATVTVTPSNIASVTYDHNNADRNCRGTMDYNLHITANAVGTATVKVTLKNGVTNSFTLRVQ